MGGHRPGEIARAMWANRPNITETLLAAMFVVATAIFTGLPLPFLIAVGLLFIVLMTTRMALKDLREPVTPPASTEGEGSGT